MKETNLKDILSSQVDTLANYIWQQTKMYNSPSFDAYKSIIDSYIASNETSSIFDGAPKWDEVWFTVGSSGTQCYFDSEPMCSHNGEWSSYGNYQFVENIEPIKIKREEDESLAQAKLLFASMTYEDFLEDFEYVKPIIEKLKAKYSTEE